METIQKFKAIDGKEFKSKEDCLEHELLIERVDSIMSVLTETPDDTDFGNGEGFIQHDHSILGIAKIKILEICKEYIDHKWIQETIDDENIHPSYVGRLIDDYYIGPLNSAWHRFMCIDKDSREWGQPYFANNPDDGKQVCINL